MDVHGKAGDQNRLKRPNIDGQSSSTGSTSRESIDEVHISALGGRLILLSSDLRRRSALLKDDFPIDVVAFGSCKGASAEKLFG